MTFTFERPLLAIIVQRLNEPRRKMQILSGPRQVGKTTLATQALAKVQNPFVYVIAEKGFTTTWIEQQWALARARALEHPDGAILVIDEIQKIENWSERVKRLWDEDTFNAKSLKVLLLGSSALLLNHGLTESMMGRYEVINISHWSLAECQDAFGLSLDEYLYFGGYPGALEYRHDETRFSTYMRDSIIEPVISQDILSQFVIHKPALLRQLFNLGCEYSAQILSYNKMLGQLQDAGNTTTLSHYLRLLDQAGVLRGLLKFSKERLRQRQSSPKFQIYNTALMTSVHGIGFSRVMNNPEIKGRWVESAVGSHLLMEPSVEVFYWRENNKEVDFIVRIGEKLIAIEVKGGEKRENVSGIIEFVKIFAPTNTLLVGTAGIPLETFLKVPLQQFL